MYSWPKTLSLLSDLTGSCHGYVHGGGYVWIRVGYVPDDHEFTDQPSDLPTEGEAHHVQGVHARWHHTHLPDSGEYSLNVILIVGYWYQCFLDFILWHTYCYVQSNGMTQQGNFPYITLLPLLDLNSILVLSLFIGEKLQPFCFI